MAALGQEAWMELVVESVSNSLWPHGRQHTRLLCPSPSPRVCSRSCPLSRWCHPTISSSVVPFSSCLQSLPASGSFLRGQLFASGGQSIGASASASMNLQGWSPLGDWFDLALQGTLKNLLRHPSSKAPSLWHTAFFSCPALYMTAGKTTALSIWK